MKNNIDNTISTLRIKKRFNVSIAIFLIWFFCISLYLSFINFVKIPYAYSIFITVSETVLCLLMWAFFMIKIDWLKDLNTGKEIVYLNISNVLSAIRLTLVPLLITMFGLLVLIDGHYRFRIFIFVFTVLVCFTDLFDGMLARKLNQVTNLGKVLDPVGDFLMIICFSVLVYIYDIIYWWFFLLVMIRIPGLIITAFFLISLDIRFRVKTSFIGKLTIFYILCFLGFSTIKLLLFYENHYYDFFLLIAQIIGAVIILISSVEKILLLVHYIKNQDEFKLQKDNIHF